MQTVIHPHGPRAAKSQPEFHLKIYKPFNYLINLILTHRSDPTLCCGAGRIFLWQLTRPQQHDSP